MVVHRSLPDETLSDGFHNMDVEGDSERSAEPTQFAEMMLPESAGALGLRSLVAQEMA